MMDSADLGAIHPLSSAPGVRLKLLATTQNRIPAVC